MGDFAGRNGAVVDEVMMAADFVYSFSSEGERRVGGENRTVGAKTDAGRAGYVIERSGFEVEVVGAVRGANVIVVRAAVEREVAGRRGFVGVGVERGFVGFQNIGFVI